MVVWKESERNGVELDVCDGLVCKWEMRVVFDVCIVCVVFLLVYECESTSKF